ncbi:MAG: FAD-binding protein [Betaproteobacteria bacterium]|nr:FAD-binding protein [Candidatus Fonsibacter lacus]
MNAPLTPAELPVVAQRPVPPEFIEALQARFGDQCSTAMAVREQHGRDESVFVHVPPPAAVVFAHNTTDVADAVALCQAHRVPVIPFGVGSSLEGHLLATQGGISLDVSRMDKVLSIEPENLIARVQPGVTRKALNEALRNEGLFFPIDPGADASLGGMTATRASGTNAVAARKSSAGYDLTRLLVGSEGTLGVITEVTVKLYPLPEAVMAAVCSFPSVEAAVRTTIQIIQLGVPIARCELLDDKTVRMVNRYAKLTLPENPMLLMEFHGSPSGVAEQIETVKELATEWGGSDFSWADTPEERNKLWTARHNAYFAGLQARPGCRAISTDTCVPISQLAECVTHTVAEAEAAGVQYFLVGHVGDGNFHMGYLIDPNDAAELELVERLNASVVARALSLGGTCTGEHGIGLHKRGFLLREAGDEAVHAMRAIKQALDPLGILNPGKIF